MFLKVWLRLGLDIKHQDQYDEAWRDMSGHIPRVCFEYIKQSWFVPYNERFCAARLVRVDDFGHISSSKV